MREGDAVSFYDRFFMTVDMDVPTDTYLLDPISRLREPPRHRSAESAIRESRHVFMRHIIRIHKDGAKRKKKSKRADKRAYKLGGHATANPTQKSG